MDNIEIKENNVPTPEVNQKNNKSKGPIIVIILLIIALLGTIGYILYDRGIIFKTNTETKEESKNEENNIEENKKEVNNEISNDLKNQLLNIIGIPNELKYLTTEEAKEYGLTGDKWTLLNYGGYFAYYDVNKEIIINKISVDYKKRLIRSYAENNNIFESNVFSDENDENGSIHSCLIPSGSCDGISVDNYKKIAKLYNFDENGETIFSSNERYNNYYLYNEEGYLDMPSQVDLDIKYNYNNTNIIVDYLIKIKSFDNNTNIDKSIKYTFKQYDDGSYYLYSVFVKNN